jgi:hypothetical protein
MTMILPPGDVDDLRQRIEVDPSTASDELLLRYLAQAARIVGNELPPGGDYSAEPTVAEALQQIAVKLWDLRPRGVQSLDMDGGAEPPAMPATAGLVRSVRGLLLPVMPDAGITT